MPKVNQPQLRFIVRKDKLALRCTFKGQSAEMKTELTSDGFDKKKQMYKGNRKGNLEIDKMLTKCEERINDGIVDVKQIITSDAPSKDSFTYIVGKYIEENDLKPGTIEIHKSALNHMIKCFGDDATSFNDKKLIDYFKGIGISDSTIAMYIARIRAWGFKIDTKYVKKYRFAKRDYYLTDSQILNVMRYYTKNVNANVRGWKGFELFIIMFHTALSPVDLFRLKKKQFTFSVVKRNKYMTIKGKRSKTGIDYKIVLPQYHMVYDIYNKYEGEHYLPYLDGVTDEKRIENKVSGFLEYYTPLLRDILKEADKTIDVDRVTFYVARHSKIMSLLNKSIPPAQVALFLGRSINTISQYFHELETEQMLDIANI